MRTIALLTVFAIGCSEQVRVVAESGDIAVGARFRFAILDSSCDESGATSFAVSLAAGLAFQAFVTSQGHPILALPPISTAPSCRKVQIDTISEAASSDAATLAVVDGTVDQDIALVEVEARAAGSAEVRVAIETARGSRSASTTLHAAQVARAELTADCPPGTDESFIPIGATSGYSFALTGASGQRLLGFGYLPTATSDLTFSYPTIGDSSGRVTADLRYLNITWPTNAGDLTLIWPDAAVPRKTVTLYDQSAYTSLAFSPPAGTVVPLANKNGVRFDALGRTGSRTSCWYDPIPRHYFTDTPTICNLSLGLGSPKTTDLTASGVVVYGLAAGTCRLHAEVPNTALATAIDLTIQ